MRHLKCLSAALSVTMIASASGKAVAAPASINKIQARELSTEALKQRVLSQLADMLIEAPRPTGGKTPKRPLTDLWFSTRAQATEVQGVCRSDTVVLEFQPVRPTQDSDAKTSVHATGLSAFPTFYVATDQEAVACDRLDPFDPRFISAATASTARRGADLLKSVAAGAASGPPPFALDCSGDTPTCAKNLTTLSLADVSEIEDCASDEDERALRSCAKFSMDDRIVTVIYRAEAQPIQILKVISSETITFTHDRID